MEAMEKAFSGKEAKRAFKGPSRFIQLIFGVKKESVVGKGNGVFGRCPRREGR